MYQVVERCWRSDGKHALIRVPNSTGWSNADDLVADIRENGGGLGETGVDTLPPKAEDIRDGFMEKVEPVLCFDGLGKGAYYLGIKRLSAPSLCLVSNKDKSCLL
ncbi:hypothetical protein [Acidithiobacillus sp.]|uniref:hypothetical protein n=1 Tax=Acidithiobacillus sp. TaxID=1872118 RepID=UPI0025B91FE2|nr:hypothetical protein [Acidithiobacillus sp.]